MENDRAVGGYRLLEAFSHLLTEPHQKVVAALEIQRRNQTAQDADAAFYRWQLWLDLTRALQSRNLLATGFLPGALQPSAINGAFFNNAIPDFEMDSVSSHGVVYAGVRILHADAAPPLLASQTSGRSAGKGGRPPVHDWPSFTREVVRIAAVDGLTNRQALVSRMVEWCEASWPEDQQPDRATIGRHVQELWPQVLPEV